MTRYVLLAFVCMGASTARAESTIDGATVTFEKLFIHENNKLEFQEPSTEDAQLQYFNFAHCTCAQSHRAQPIANFNEFEFQWLITVDNPMNAVINQPLQLWTGVDCGNETDREMRCLHVGDTSDISVIASQNGAYETINILDLVSPRMEGQTCPDVEQDMFTWALASTQNNGQLDFNVSKAIKVDTEAPDMPTNWTAAGAENAIEISWTPPDNTTDVLYYQALCAKARSGAPGKPEGQRPPPRFQSGRRLCGNTDVPFFTSTTLDTGTPVDGSGGGDVDAGIDDAGIDDAGVDASIDDAPTGVAEPEGFANADAEFLCEETDVSTARGLRIDGLENGTEYIVSVLVVDRAGNAQGTKFTTTITPRPVTDFWEDLHDQGSEVEGGFCLLSQTYGDQNPLTSTLRSFRDNTLADTFYGRWLIDVYYGTIGRIDLHGSIALRIVAGVLLLPLVVFALLWHLLTLPGLLAVFAFLYMMRRRKLVLARYAAASTIACIAFLPARAHAQSPYWENTEFANENVELAPDDPERVHWHAGLRLGPYVPGIDSQIDMPAGKFAGPYEQMFGGYAIMPMIDIDYFFLRSYGQLGVGLSLGYMGKKEHPWEFGSSPTDPDRMRVSGDWNKFRLIPASLNAVYRLTYLDDNYGIPIVPYARGGLAYYVWWITAPNGDFATSCKGPNTSTDCAKTTAAGASLGLVGSIGLAIRAERIDMGAARSMRDSGIEHAGFYAEYSIGKVDGFGSDKKLSVGDATWFAGVDFEF